MPAFRQRLRLSTDREGVAKVLCDAFSIVPGLEPATIRQIRTGFRPMSEDNRPLLRKIPNIENLLIGKGFGRSGLTMGPYCGKLLAELALGGRVEIDLAGYDPMHR